MPRKQNSDLIPCVKQFKELRKMKGISVEDLSDKTGISVSAITSMESGRRHPNVRTLDLLCRGIGANGLIVGGW